MAAGRHIPRLLRQTRRGLGRRPAVDIHRRSLASAASAKPATTFEQDDDEHDGPSPDAAADRGFDDGEASTAAADDEETTARLLEADRRHVLHPYTSMTDPLPTFPVRSARGVHIELRDGSTVVDGMSSWWAAVHGYRHPVLDAAVREQVEESMSHVMFGGITHAPAVGLCARLLRMVNGDVDCLELGDWEAAEEGGHASDEHPESYLEELDLDRMQNYQLTKVFLSDSGSVSVEVAMKMALQYWHTTGEGRKTTFLSLRNGYHGDTLGAMSVCDPVGGMHSMFAGVLAQQAFVPSPAGPTVEDADDTLRAMDAALAERSEEIAAVILEPIVQGAGGMRFYHPKLLRGARELCDRHDVLLIFDEIATGFGRTGTMFAGWQDGRSYRPWSSLDGRNLAEGESAASGDTDESNEGESIVYPDIVCLGKALTGGYMTMGATITNDRVARGISDGGGVFMHGPTFMANPLACATALASTGLLLRSPWRRRVRDVEAALVEHMSPLAGLDDVVEEVRVLGAIGVCQLREPLCRDGMAVVQRRLVEEGVWLRPFGRLVYTMPPFNCDELDEGHIRKIGEAVYKILSSVRCERK